MVVELKRGTSKEEVDALIKKMDEAKPKQKGFNAKKYCGILKLTEDPMDIQKRLRDEWD